MVSQGPLPVAQTPVLVKVTSTVAGMAELSGLGTGLKLITPAPPQGTMIFVGIAIFTE